MMATETHGDWHIVSRQTNDPVRPLFAVLARLLFLTPVDEPPKHSSVTWTVRHLQTGEVRTITANSEKEFEERLAVGAFD
jgi:hypothetical protein